MESHTFCQTSFLDGKIVIIFEFLFQILDVLIVCVPPPIDILVWITQKEEFSLFFLLDQSLNHINLCLIQILKLIDNNILSHTFRRQLNFRICDPSYFLDCFIGHMIECQLLFALHFLLNFFLIKFKHFQIKYLPLC